MRLAISHDCHRLDEEKGFGKIAKILPEKGLCNQTLCHTCLKIFEISRAIPLMMDRLMSASLIQCLMIAKI